jgi:hypothetical protein
LIPQGHLVILLAEDHVNDVLLIKRAFRKAQIANPIQIVGDGDGAGGLPGGRVTICGTPAISSVDADLLDLKLPRRSSFEVLARLSAQPVLDHPQRAADDSGGVIHGGG